VNPGGEPDRDDFGLPPADIEIPDDARELDRDVQAYHREQRALRRDLRRRRWAGPIARDGMVLPLLGGCLVLALIAGTLLTVFTAVPGDLSSQPRSDKAGGQAGGATPATSVSAVTGPGRLLPAATIEVGTTPQPLQTLTDSVLTLVPPGCTCAAAVRALTKQAQLASVRVYLVGTGVAMRTVRQLAASTPGVMVADDVHNALRLYPRRGLTALLVDAHGRVSLAARLRPTLELTRKLLGLAPSPAPQPATRRPVTASP
jgi:hypothetical protein